jgi:hypothetical protein
MVKWGLILACLGWAQIAFAQEEEFPSLSVGGLLFGDFYAVPSNHTIEGDGAAGMVLRRGYLTFDGDYSDNWFSRMRFELNQSGEFETYDFELSFKDLFLGWNIGRQKLLLGLSPTPTFDLIESIWGSRYLVRTPLDLHGVASRDTGVSLKGPINSSGTLAYRFMMGTKVNIGNESDDHQKWMGAISWKPSANWVLDFYLDYEGISGSFDRSTIQGFAGYQTDRFAWGLHYSNQDREEDRPLELASTFIRSSLTEKVTLIGRVDRLFEPSPRANNIDYLPYDPTARATTLIAGVEFHASPHLFITPNIFFTRYDHNDLGVRPNNDLHLRLTLFIDFE